MTELVTAPAALTAVLERARGAGSRVGLVPTMGALHPGHVALVGRALAENDAVVCSIFVNPLQFDRPDDLRHYPRDLAADLERLERLEVAWCFAPDDAAMYPSPPEVRVDPGPLGGILEGASRPGHLGGVATVVTKLFSIVGASRAYFGEKDYQQLVLVRHLVRDLSIPVEVVGCETVRAADGLAESSRNAALTPAARAAALVLPRALAAGRVLVAAGGAKPDEVEAEMAAVVGSEPAAALDYAAVRSALDLRELDELRGELRLLVAARVGGVRLIDNAGVAA